MTRRLCHSRVHWALQAGRTGWQEGWEFPSGDFPWQQGLGDPDHLCHRLFVGLSWILRAQNVGKSMFFHEAERTTHNYQEETLLALPLIPKNVLFFLGFIGQGHKNPNSSQECVVSGI